MTTLTTARVETAHLADQLERAFRGGSWHGPSVTQALAGVDAAAANRRPLAAAHSIWEIALHITAWIDTARRRILGETIGDLSLELDWPPTANGSEEAWRTVLSDLEEAHRSLHATVLELEDARLEDPVAGCDPTVRGLLLGVLQHNVYHAGQISVLKKAEATPGGAA
ncbi:MAG: DinB family protein [bacterium]|nr:DinB family protein [bacterium]